MADKIKVNYRKRVQNARERLFREQNGLCYYCSKAMLLVKGRADARCSARQITLDHIIPRSKGGSLAPTQNAVAACYQCNQERGDQDARMFLLKKQGML